MIEVMFRYNWPGNVRELQNVLQRFVTLNQFDLMKETKPIDLDIKAFVSPPKDAKEKNYQTLIDRFERTLIEHTLQQHQWQREVSAKSLGLSLRTFYRKLERHGLVRQK